VTTGAGGALVSTVKELELESVLVLPAASLARAVTEREASDSAVGWMRLQLPEASAVAVPTEPRSLRNTSMERPAAAVPL
jgi:hypothetical protein